MKIVLAYLCQYSDRNDPFFSLFPYGLTTIASYLQKKNFNIYLANYSKIGYKKSIKKLKADKPDILALSIFSYNRIDSFKLIKEIKKNLPELKIIIGGHHPSFLADEILKRYPEVDYIIQGEGELLLEQLLIDIKSGKPREKIISGNRIDDLDSIPSPSAITHQTYNINVNEQFKYIITSRGCAYSCTYCSSPSFWKRKIRFRSPENIIKELKYIRQKYGIIYFSIRDDNFTIDKKRVMKFCSLLQKSNLYMMWNCQARVDSVDEEMLVEMKKSGLEHIQYGVESGSERILQKYDKSISIETIISAAQMTRNAGIYLSIYLMTGMIGEKKSDVEKTVALIKKILPGDGIVSPVAYYPGTALYEEMKSKGKIKDDDWFKSNNAGLFVRNDRDVKIWINRLLLELGKIREKSWYREKDFISHRRLVGDDCWVTDILEADYYHDIEDYDIAEDIYLKITEKYPENIWGYYRLGKLYFLIEEYDLAKKYYLKAQDIVPEFYGTWMKLAETELALGNRKLSRKYTLEANQRNKFDFRIKNLMKIHSM